MIKPVRPQGSSTIFLSLQCVVDLFRISDNELDVKDAVNADADDADADADDADADADADDADADDADAREDVYVTISSCCLEYLFIVRFSSPRRLTRGSARVRMSTPVSVSLVYVISVVSVHYNV